MWMVVLPAEYPECAEAFGPYKTEADAEKARNEWNLAHASEYDGAVVLLVRPKRYLVTS